MIKRVTLSDEAQTSKVLLSLQLLTQKPSALQTCLSCAMTNDPKHLKKGTLYVKYCTESSRNGFFVNETAEFIMMYALL